MPLPLGLIKPVYDFIKNIFQNKKKEKQLLVDTKTTMKNARRIVEDILSRAQQAGLELQAKNEYQKIKSNPTNRITLTVHQKLTVASAKRLIDLESKISRIMNDKSANLPANIRNELGELSDKLLQYRREYEDPRSPGFAIARCYTLRDRMIRIMKAVEVAS